MTVDPISRRLIQILYNCSTSRLRPPYRRALLSSFQCAPSSRLSSRRSASLGPSKSQIDQWTEKLIQCQSRKGKKRKSDSMTWFLLEMMNRTSRFSWAMKRQALLIRSLHPQNSTCNQVLSSESAWSSREPSRETNPKSHYPRNNSQLTKLSSPNEKEHRPLALDRMLTTQV